jgi:putative exosortase-associated protein (TIGR04073 family)
MRNTVYLLGSMALLALLGAGCAGPEEKMGRGFGNIGEAVRMGEMERSVEQAGLFNGTDSGVATGFVKGLDHTLVRTGVGIYEVVTFPIPPYHPVLTDYMAPKPLYPDGYKPRKWSAAVFDTDRNMGFSGGDVAPWFPGSKFRVFDN